MSNLICGRAYLLAWIPMVFIAIGNAALREKLYGPRIPELAGHQVSTITLVVFLTGYVYGVIRLWPPRSGRHAWVIGFWWMMLTVAFEFSFGHYVAGHSWSRLLADYNFLAGRIWILIPLWIAVAPRLMYRHCQGVRSGRLGKDGAP